MPRVANSSVFLERLDLQFSEGTCGFLWSSLFSSGCDPLLVILRNIYEVLICGISPTFLALFPDQSFGLAIKKCKIMDADSWDLILL